MADISSLNLAPSEPIDFDNYKGAGEARPFPKKGRYIVRAPEAFTAESFGVSKAGALTAQIDPTIVGPDGEGMVLRFTKVSAKPFKRGTTTVSQMGDYLKACGVGGKLSGDPQELANAIEATANKTYEVDVDWRVWKDGFSVEGMQNFPSDGNGGYLPYVQHPTLTNPETGEPLVLRANLSVSRYIAAS